MIPPHERRNYSEIYLKLDLGKLSAEIPDFDFSAYLSHLLHRPLNTSEEVVIYALPYFKQLTKLMKNSNKRYCFFS
jgi:membrane metallo-endopeptidase-like protein 1